MIVVGLTGGIGSGKTTVAKLFYELGIPIYIADLEAKKLMNRSKIIKRKLIELFGTKAYLKGTLNKPYLADQIFNDQSLLQKMNAIIHPKVGAHFKRWVRKQDAPYVIKEAAILFENGTYLNCDYMITVTALEQDRIKWVMKRDNTSKKKIQAIIKNQWTDDKKMALSDFIIKNIELSKTKKQVDKIHRKILEDIQ